MGYDIDVIEKEKYLSDTEINKENNLFLRELFMKYKNYNGAITPFALSRMLNNLIDDSILNKIFEFCSSKDNTLIYNDFLYFYTLLKTKSFNAKMNFILYFIFSNELSITKDVYIYNVKKYYHNSYLLYKTLLNENIINDNKIEKEKVFNYIKNNYRIDIENYQLNKQICNFNYDKEFEEQKEKEKEKENEIEKEKEKNLEKLSLKTYKFSEGLIDPEKNVFSYQKQTIFIKDKIDYNDNNKNFSRKNSFNNHIIINSQKYCLCLNKTTSINDSVDYSRIFTSLYKKYDKLKEKFEEYKRKNKGIFPLSLLEDMLKEINVVPSLIDLVCNYIKKRTQKSICTFDLFKQVLSILTIPLDEKENNNKNKENFTNGLFLLFSYPKDYIDKTDFCTFIKLTKKKYTLSYINNLLNKYEIPVKIKINKFQELIDYLINELMESLEHIKYIPYIYFDFKLPDKKMEKIIIDILLNGQGLDEYIKKRVQIDDTFYVIDYAFWEKWNKLMKNEKILDLRIHTENISDQNGKINEGLVYLSDYIILSKRIYDLFCKWYRTPAIEIEREKIYIDDEKVNNLYYKSLNSLDKELNAFLQGEDAVTHKKFEIEMNPVFLVFLNFQEVQNSCQHSFQKFKEEIRKKIEDKNTEFYKFSRKEKFSSLLATLQSSIEMELDESNSKLWIYYQDRFESANINETLEQKGVFNNAAILLEVNKNGVWPMEEFDLIDKDSEEFEDFKPVGIMNIGNSCYMNSILQIFLNIDEIKEFFVSQKLDGEQEFLNFLINYKSSKDILVEEFINLLFEKWVKNKKTLSPRKFKEVCGKFNEAFKGFIQQDAYDFYTFLVQNLHEGTNIKTKETNIINKEEIDTNENDLGNEYWANTVRNNASYIYSLFMGQLQSKLTCNNCQKCKIKYEPYSALDLPLPEENKIKLFIKLFRLPLTLSPFYKDNDNNKETISDYLKNFKKIKIGNFTNKKKNKKKDLIDSDDDDDNNNSKSNRMNGAKRYDITSNEKADLELQTSRKLNTLSKTNSKDELITNELNFNIPILLKIEISRKKPCKDIISTLKDMNELSLDIKSKYTEFIIISNNKYINKNSIIDDTLEESKEIKIYELLNFEGIKEVFNYNDLKDKKAITLDKQEINKIDKKETNIDKDEDEDEDDYIVNEESEMKEILIEIKHRIKKNWEGIPYLINFPLFNEIPSNRDFIILTNKKSIKVNDLYEMMWEKYMYFCDVPSKLENNLWWRNYINKDMEEISNENDEESKKEAKNKNNLCSPFIIKIIDKETQSCAFCPWFRLCTGCILDPSCQDYINIPKNCYLIVEWCRKVLVKQLKNENILLSLNHSSMNETTTEESNTSLSKKISIYDCFELFTKKEIIEDVFCENCKEKRSFSKVLRIERIPEYLVISLKRFKYTKMYNSKIGCPINFPMTDIDLKNYLVENSNERIKVYDLFAVVDHIGNLSSGHYHANIRQKNNWINYNDSRVSKLNKTFDTQHAYILVYKYVKDRNNNKYFRFNFRGLMDTAYRIYLKQTEFDHYFNYLTDENDEIIEEYKENCGFYYGEPVIVNKEKGYITNIIEENGIVYAKIKIDKKYLKIKYTSDEIKKETIKDNEVKKGERHDNDNNTAVCGGCHIF